MRLDHWANALHGGPDAARSMLGQQVEYNRVPYFYSDQYDLGMECSGLPLPRQPTTRSSTAATAPRYEFIACWLNGGRLVAGMNVNVWDVTGRHPVPDPLRTATLDPARLTDPAIPLSDV